MKKAIREWAFNLFTKRITVKVSNLPNDAKIEYLVNKLMNELFKQGHDIRGINMPEFFSVFGHKDGTIAINTGDSCHLKFKRLTKV